MEIDYRHKIDEKGALSDKMIYEINDHRSRTNREKHSTFTYLVVPLYLYVLFILLLNSMSSTYSYAPPMSNTVCMT